MGFNMEQGKIRVFCGCGQGKTSMAIGRAVLAANQGKSVIMIQFLKGKLKLSDHIMKRLEPEIKVFRFEKYETCYRDLTDEQKEEEAMNIRNALNFAKKVMGTGEGDLVILDEVLALVDLGIVTVEELIRILESKDDGVEVIMTGQVFPEGMGSCVDDVVKVEIG